jgi:hypothetical protein
MLFLQKNVLGLNFALLGLIPLSFLVIAINQQWLIPHIILLLFALLISIVEPTLSKIAWMIRISFPIVMLILLTLINAFSYEPGLLPYAIVYLLFLASVSITLIRILKLYTNSKNWSKEKEGYVLYGLLGLCFFVVSVVSVYGLTSSVEAEKQKFMRQNLEEKLKDLQRSYKNRDVDSSLRKIKRLEFKVDSLKHVVLVQDTMYDILQMRSVRMIEELKELKGKK